MRQDGPMDRIMGWLPLTVFFVLTLAGIAIGFAQFQSL
jgi:cytochrome b subunit of formate dehydrogenase